MREAEKDFGWQSLSAGHRSLACGACACPARQLGCLSTHGYSAQLKENISPHVELAMAPHVGFHTDQIKDKSRKDLLYLLEGVSEGARRTDLRKAAANHDVCRYGGRRIWSLRGVWLAQSAYSSSSRLSRIMASTKFSSLKTATQMSVSEMWSSLPEERVQGTPNP
jgi:hypothetical protein